MFPSVLIIIALTEISVTFNLNLDPHGTLSLIQTVAVTLTLTLFAIIYTFTVVNHHDPSHNCSLTKLLPNLLHFVQKRLHQVCIVACMSQIK